MTYFGTDVTYVYADLSLILAAGVDTSTKAGTVYYDLILIYTEVATGSIVPLQTD